MTTQNIYNRIKQNYRNSDLTMEQFAKSCMQCLQVKRNNPDCKSLSVQEQEMYLRNNNILGSRFLGDAELVDILNCLTESNILDIFTEISPDDPKLSPAWYTKIDFRRLLKDNSKKILIVNPEMYLNQISKICSSGKQITIWTIHPYIYELLMFEYGNNHNINIKLIDIYNEQVNESEKFDKILCVTHFALKRKFNNLSCKAKSPSAISAELLIKHNLAEDGKLIIVMPDSINFSRIDTSYRQEYLKNLQEVIRLQAGIFSKTNVKTNIYIFSNKSSDYLRISDSTDVLGEKCHINDVMKPDETWDFEGAFGKKDDDVMQVLNKVHYKLSDISAVLRGKSLSRLAQETNKNEDFNYIDSRAIKENGIDFAETTKYLIEKDLSSEYLQDGDLLIPNKGNSSRIIVYRNINKRCLASANLLIIRPNKNLITSDYLLLYLRSPIGQKLLKSIQRQSNIPFITHEDLKGVAVIVPSLLKQKELVEKYTSQLEIYKKQITEIEDKIEQLEQNINDLICNN